LKAKTSLLDFQFFDFASLLALVFQSSLKGESVWVWGHCHSQVPFRRKNNNIGSSIHTLHDNLCVQVSKGPTPPNSAILSGKAGRSWADPPLPTEGQRKPERAHEEIRSQDEGPRRFPSVGKPWIVTGCVLSGPRHRFVSCVTDLCSDHPDCVRVSPPIVTVDRLRFVFSFPSFSL
jgi:hypothetical protein